MAKSSQLSSTLAVTLLLSACSGAPLPTAAQLTAENKTLVVMGLRISNQYDHFDCVNMSASLIPQNGPPEPVTIGGPQERKTGIGILNGAIPAGNYRVSEVTCQNTYTQSSRFVSQGAAGFSSVALKAGENADLGLLSLDVLIPEKIKIFGVGNEPTQADIFSIVGPLPQEMSAKINDSIKAKLTVRTMTATAVSKQELQARCTQMRGAQSSLLLGGDRKAPPVCEI